MPARRGIFVYNRQRRVRFDLPWLRRLAAAALEECEKGGVNSAAPLAGLEEIEISVVSDRRIAEVHQRFMNVTGPTDVITFEHGEIVISAETAARQAREYGQGLEHELGLYVIHGLLHLDGHDDLNPADRVAMDEAQEALLARCAPHAEDAGRA